MSLTGWRHPKTNKPPHKEMCRGFSMLRPCRGLVYLASQLLDVVAVDVVVVLHELVDVSLGGELDDEERHKFNDHGSALYDSEDDHDSYYESGEYD